VPKERKLHKNELNTTFFCSTIVIMYLSFFFFFVVARQNCFKPKRVVTDFEVAIHKAVGNVWPNVTVIGCKFHFTQCWFRKI
jgi:hypothetical protein